MGYKEIIYVNGDDAELVRKAASIEEERLQKIPTTHASTNTSKLSCPIYFEEGSGSADYDTVQNVMNLSPNVKQHTDWLMNLNLCPMLCLPSRSLLYMKISRLT